MKERTDRISALLEKWLRKELTSEERTELDAWLSEGDENRALFQQMTDQGQLLERLRIYNLANRDAIWNKTMNGVDQGAKVIELPKKRIAWYKYAAAAAVVVTVSVAGYFIVNQGSEKTGLVNKEETVPVKSDLVVPGGNVAELTLEDGSKIQLDKVQDGDLTQQGAMLVSKAGGLLTYSGRFITSGPVSTGSKKHASLHNMVSTPRGGQYQITLPDGSKVWLNAASSLRFPLAFAGNQRTVELTGEAYFEIKKMSLPGSAERMPFIVKMVGKYKAEVAVLGTHFKVYAYDDEKDIRTTLMEGSVKVNQGTATKILKPGQQAIAQDGAIRIVEVDIENEMGLKDGMITATGETETFINQIARWYDVEVQYESKVPELKKQQDALTASIPRSETFESVLKVLRNQGIQAHLEKRKLIIK